MTQFPTPNARFRHLFVVVRLPAADDGSVVGDLGERVTLTKAFWSEGEARVEADRLTDLNGDLWSYSVDVVRLVEAP